MRRILIALGAVLAVAVAWAGCIFVANRFHVPAAIASAQVSAPGDLPVAGSELTLAIWNIGYAGMGAEADFVMDLGQQSRPASQALVERNAGVIATRAEAFGTDLILMQEMARPSWNTYGVDVLDRMVTGLPAYGHVFGADIETRFMPPGLGIEIGNASFSRLEVLSAETRALPLEPDFTLGMFRKTHRMHILRLAGPEQWVVINIHLSAFDNPADAVREKQLAAVLAFAQAEYAAGRHVVIGGDWNMRLVGTVFPNTTEPRFLFWLRDLDPSVLPLGWTLGVDPGTPTSRANYQPYVEGENFRLIIDGYLVSPNVEIAAVHGTDLHFLNSDHNPVMLTVRTR